MVEGYRAEGTRIANEREARENERRERMKYRLEQIDRALGHNLDYGKQQTFAGSREELLDERRRIREALGLTRRMDVAVVQAQPERDSPGIRAYRERMKRRRYGGAAATAGNICLRCGHPSDDRFPTKHVLRDAEGRCQWGPCECPGFVSGVSPGAAGLPNIYTPRHPTSVCPSCYRERVLTGRDPGGICDYCVRRRETYAAPAGSNFPGSPFYRTPGGPPGAAAVNALCPKCGHNVSLIFPRRRGGYSCDAIAVGDEWLCECKEPPPRSRRGRPEAAGMAGAAPKSEPCPRCRTGKVTVERTERVNPVQDQLYFWCDSCTFRETSRIYRADARATALRESRGPGGAGMAGAGPYFWEQVVLRSTPPGWEGGPPPVRVRMGVDSFAGYSTISRGLARALKARRLGTRTVREMSGDRSHPTAAVWMRLAASGGPCGGIWRRAEVLVVDSEINVLGIPEIRSCGLLVQRP